MPNGNAKNEPIRENESVGVNGACSQTQERAPPRVIIAAAEYVFLTAIWRLFIRKWSNFFFCLFMTDDTTSPAAVHDRRADWVVLLVSASALMCLACQRRGSLLILSKSWVCVFCIRPASVCVCQSGGLSRLCERGSKSPCNYNLNSPDILPSLPRCVCVLCVLVCVYIRVRAEGLLSCGAETAGCSSLINEKPHNYR